MKQVLRFLLFLVLAGGIIGATFLTGLGAGWYVAASVTAPATPAATGTPPAPVTPGQTPQATPASPESLKVFWEAWDVISRDFYGRKTLDAQKMVYGAIKGMVDSLGDPHTYFLTPSNARLATEDLQGSFEGIGATVEKRDNKLLVVAPIEGTPADKAGIKAGDHITTVDGKSTAPLNVTEAVALIRGKAGTVVKLTVLREGVKDPLTFEITRAKIEMSTVRTQELEGGIAYVKLNSFSEPTTQELSNALKKLLANKPKGLILDLRNNPGGYLSTSVEVASQFMKDGVVLYEENADGQRQPFRVQRGGLAVDVPMVILVNKGSASASEIVAGALQDAKRAPLIGEKTFGKGSVQTTHALSDGSSVHVTIAHWLTPMGRQIHDIGLDPDIVVPLTEDDATNNKDPQLDRALEYLKTGK